MKEDLTGCNFSLLVEQGVGMEIKAMEQILKQIDNRYEAIRVIAKEARRINNVVKQSGEEIEEKPTSIAISRIIEGKVKYRYEEPGEEQ